MKTVVADLTSAKAGSESRLLETLVSAFPDDVEGIHVVCLTHQQPIISMRFADRIRTLSAEMHYTQIAAYIQKEFIDSFTAQSPTNDSSLSVISFHTAVLGLVAYLPPPLRVRVEFIRWTRLFGPSASSGAPGSKEMLTQAIANLMPENELLGAVTRMLTHSKATDSRSALLMSDMRALLEREDPRFKKSNPAAAVHGLIGGVIELAQQRGLVVVDRSVNRFNSPVWLTGNGSTTPESLNTPGTATAENGSFPLAVSDEVIAGRNPSEPVIPTAEAGQNGPQQTEKVESRSDHFVASLRRQSLGPFSRVRKQVFDTIDQLVKNPDPRRTASGLIRDSVETVHQQLKLSGDTNGEFPWRRVREFVRELLVRRAVLLDVDGKPVTPSFQTLSTEVVGLSPDWRLELDGELILALIRDGMKLHMGDLGFLAGALFNERTNEGETQVEAMLEHLIRSRRITEDAEHFLVEIPICVRERNRPRQGGIPPGLRFSSSSSQRVAAKEAV